MPVDQRGGETADPNVDPEDLARVGVVLQEKYRLDRLLGSGGMGAVYEATNAWTGRRVAIKVLRGHYAKHSAILERFVQEARTATALAHPNIVEVLDICREPDGLIFIVQELLAGRDLRARIDLMARPFTAKEAIDIALPIMGALVAVHRAGVVHRDIKPENIFIVRTRQGGEVPKLIDFGVSKINDPQYQRAATQQGVTVGTPDYMAPEQARGEVSIDARADVWSMGVVLFELLSNRLPFEGPTPNAVLVEVMTKRAPSLATIAPWVPGPLSTVVDRALLHDREQRWGSMRQFLSALLESVESPPDRAALVARHHSSLPPLGEAPEAGRTIAEPGKNEGSDFAMAPAAVDDDDFGDEDPTRLRVSPDASNATAPAAASEFSSQPTVLAPAPPLLQPATPWPASSSGTVMTGPYPVVSGAVPTPMAWGPPNPPTAGPPNVARLRTLVLVLCLVVMALAGGLAGVWLSFRNPSTVSAPAGASQSAASVDTAPIRALPALPPPVANAPDVVSAPASPSVNPMVRPPADEPRRAATPPSRPPATVRTGGRSGLRPSQVYE